MYNGCDNKKILVKTKSHSPSKVTKQIVIIDIEKRSVPTSETWTEHNYPKYGDPKGYARGPPLHNANSLKLRTVLKYRWHSYPFQPPREAYTVQKLHQGYKQPTETNSVHAFMNSTQAFRNYALNHSENTHSIPISMAALPYPDLKSPSLRNPRSSTRSQIACS